MTITGIVRALVQAGASPEMILAAVEAAEAEQVSAIEKRRAADADRQRRHREARNVMSRDVTVTGRDSRDGPLKGPPPSPRPPITPPISPQDPPSAARERVDAGLDETDLAFDAYNDAAKAAGWPKASKLNPSRKASLKARVHDAGGLDGWRNALGKARGSPFLTGNNDRGWLPSLDFFLQQSSFTKLIEGAYDRRTPAEVHDQPRSPQRRSNGHDALAAALFGDQPSGFDDDPRRQVVPGRDEPGGKIVDLAPDRSVGRYAGAWR